MSTFICTLIADTQCHPKFTKIYIPFCAPGTLKSMMKSLSLTLTNLPRYCAKWLRRHPPNRSTISLPFLRSNFSPPLSSRPHIKQFLQKFWLLWCKKLQSRACFFGRVISTISKKIPKNTFGGLSALRAFETPKTDPKRHAVASVLKSFRDIEGSDTDTRRRVASDLIKALRQQFDAKVASLTQAIYAKFCSLSCSSTLQVSALCLQQLRALIGEYDKAKHANWKYKDAAVNL